MALLTNGFCNSNGRLDGSKRATSSGYLILKNALMPSWLRYPTDFDVGSAKFERVHVELGAELGIREKVLKCNEASGTDYEDAICALLKEEINWAVDKLDDGKRQNVPDVQLKLRGHSIAN